MTDHPTDGTAELPEYFVLDCGDCRYRVPWRPLLDALPRLSPAQQKTIRDAIPDGYWDWQSERCDREMQVDAARIAQKTAREQREQPIPMVLHCPECRTRHIDEGEFATKVHHTHSCQGCGLTWRPAVVPTAGVQFLPGFKSAPLVTDAPHAAEKKDVPEQRCACGLHLIPVGIHGVNWYWATHDRDKCMLELPNVRCWCGRLRSEHQDKDGHTPKGSPFVTDAPSKPEWRLVGGHLGLYGRFAGPTDAIAREIASWDQYTCSHCDQPKSAHWNDGNHLMCDNYRNERFMPVDSPATTCKHGAPNCTAEHE